MPQSTNKIPAKLPRVHRALHRWYAAHGRRDLPWRNTPDAYAIYISEIMLQQTQVKTVLERYYGPFLKRFPTAAVLADAPRGDVMKAWEGLGYYTRAANLHAAVQQAKGTLPDTVEALLALPGIGRNTAHAVACFGFKRAVPVMEANVKRVLARVFALENPDAATLWEKAELLLDRKNPYDYNQAMMDIGAMVCTRRAPRCGECPLNAICEGKAAPERYPALKAKKATPVRRRNIVAFALPGGRYALYRRETRFLNGLYGFPEYDVAASVVEFGGRRYALQKKALIGAVTQTYSHFTLEAKVYAAAAGKGPLPAGMEAVSLREMAELPLSRADHKIVRILKDRESAPDPAPGPQSPGNR